MFVSFATEVRRSGVDPARGLGWRPQHRRLPPRPAAELALPGPHPADGAPSPQVFSAVSDA